MNGRWRAGAGLTALTAVLIFAIVWMIIARLHAPIARRPGDRPRPEIVDAVEQAWPDMRIDPNTATAAELTVLPSIGPTLAERIVADREANGPFRSIEDLQRVRGVGPRTVERIREFLVIVKDAPGSGAD
jgi:competence ComEA-like helix-hairpin-helix protein